MSKWISVKDRLLETGVPVLICNPHWDYSVVANYAGNKDIWMDTWRQRMTYTPTHWMPLPGPPEELGSRINEEWAERIQQRFERVE